MRSYPSLIGQRFGSLVVQEQLPSTAKGQRRWLCRCDCGNSYISTTDNLKRRPMANCGCRKSPDLTGQVFGKLTVLGRSEKRGSRGARTTPMWECRCECGAITCKATDTLKNPDQSMCKDCADQRHAKAARDGAIVGGMNGQTQNSFSGKTVKLIADINLGDKESENNPDLIFYPIGYWNSEGTYEKTGTAISSGFYAFQGTFDGNGNTISNFYQNTWEMKGDHDWYDATLQYFRDGMGLFGKVLGGTIKNLTVDNFSCDSEIGTTGVIAAYADSKDGKPAVFENITITNCNPRVYNIGNGGIVGIGGNSNDPDTYKLTFTNITIDNTNKITALWGSWDVACGGLVGMFRGAGHVYMTNCHVGAQIDVYNDVCGNYQYYWYRYSGMMVGTNKNMTTDANGYTVPETDKFHAENCTVHFGDWNDYYYCELVANSLASYTYDHQFSRLTLIKSLDEIKSGDTWTKAGNFLLIDGDTKTCYHIVKNSDGTLKQHLHTDAGYEDSIDEDGDGNVDLKEDKQIVYLPFNQLFTGYGWGVKHVPIYDDGTRIDGIDITILDRTEANSVPKYESLGETEFSNGVAIKASNIVKYLNKCGVAEFHKAFHIGVTDLDSTDGTVTAVFNRAETWEDSTITFIGTGKVQITIQDYYFCTPTTITVEIKDREPAEKFDIVMNNGDFLHRVGNSGTVALDKLFKAKDGVTVGTISVTVEAVDGTGASGTYSNNAIQFNGTGVVKVTITDNDYCTPTVLYLEVVDAVNATSATSATSNNVVLLNNITASSLEVSNGYTFYGNGFEVAFNGDGSYRSAAVSYGFVTLKNGGTLDNTRVICKVFPKSYMFTNEMTAGSDGRYPYGYSAIIMTDDSTVSNCYVYGARNNILVSSGNALITNTVTECGSLSNIQVLSSSSYTVTLDNVTTIQYQTTSPFDTSAKVLGFGVVVGLPDSTSNATIKLTGEFTQYNWVTNADTSVSNTYTKSAISGALQVSKYQHMNNAGVTTVNTGIAYMNDLARTINDERTNTNVKYEGNSVTISGYTGYVYSVVNKSGNPDAEINRGQLKNGTSNVNVFYGKTQDDSVKLTTTFDTTTNRWISTLFLDLDAIGTYTFSFGDLIASKYGINLNYEVKDANGNAVNQATAITLNQLHNAEYTLVVTDDLIYNNKGELTGSSVKKEIVFAIHATKTSIAPPAFSGIGSGTAIRLYEKSWGTEYWRPAYDALTGVSVSYWNASEGMTKTVELSKLNTIGKINGNVWTYACDDYTLTITGGQVHTDGTTITPRVAGGKLYFASMNKHFGTGTTARDIILTYTFTDKNASTTEEWKTKVQYSELDPYNYDDFSKGTLTEVTSSSGGSSGSNPCVTSDTLVTLADGTQKRIDEVAYTDEILVWDFFKGAYDVVSAAIIFDHGYDNNTVIELKFSDGSSVKVVNLHQFFDSDLNRFVSIDADSVSDYVGHRFAKQNGSGYEMVTLVDYKITQEYCEAWGLISAEHYNVIVNGMLSTDFMYEDYALFNYFEVGDDMKFDEAKMKSDIERYGLYTHEDFAEYLTYEQFMAFNVQYFKVAVGRGEYTYEGILELIEIYLNK